MASYSRAAALAGIAAVRRRPAVACAPRRSRDDPDRRRADRCDGPASLRARPRHVHRGRPQRRDLADAHVGALIAAIVGGSLDVMTSTVVSIALAHNKGIDMRVIADRQRVRRAAAASRDRRRAELDRFATAPT